MRIVRKFLITIYYDLKQIFGTDEKSLQYLDLIANLVKACPNFVSRIEHVFEELILLAVDDLTVIPVVDRVKAQLVQELAKCYKLETKLEGEGRIKVVIYRTAVSRM